MVYLPTTLIIQLLALIIPSACSNQLTRNVISRPEARSALPSSCGKEPEKIKPKVFIISLYSREAGLWYGIPEFDILAQNITVPGFSPIFPNAHCTSDGNICQLTTGEAEINAALTISSLVHSSVFDLTTTYFLIAGIAGVNPKIATIGSVTYARFAVQVALQYEFDAREKPAYSPTGYIPLGSKAPWEYPSKLYGTEVFEVNDALRKIAVTFANQANLTDSEASQERRAHYAITTAYAAGAAAPSIVECETATSDNYWSGNLLAEAFENTTALFTHGAGVYCTSQEEDNAVLGAFLRGALWGAVDFGRIIIQRAGSDFDRPPEGESAPENLFTRSPGYPLALKNTYLAAVKVVQGILDGWEETFRSGVPAPNPIGDVLGSLGLPVATSAG